jgi:Flp pilus assembly protein TadG
MLSRLRLYLGRHLPRRLCRSRRGSASIEFALISTFIMLPLFAGAADLISIISAQAQLNTAMESLYSFAWANPTEAANATQMNALIGVINGQAGSSFHQLSLPATNNAGGANPAIAYDCIANNAATPGYASVNSLPGKCSTGQTQQINATYQLNSTVFLPVPGDTLTLTATGTVQAQ